ncbi:hypothetical protein [Anaerovibrio sp. RM50]|uniref:hypothetical protein n=1 Tax=Anaerovibrio sp. RM50 TaxID=1200557 RepID=UPI000483D4A8|nr:hypothetical protein [Anaerovibrio sp. RM50]
MKKITVLLFMLLMVASTAFASSQSDRWASINVLDKGFALYYDKDTINYDSDSHMLSSWVRIDISEEARGKYKKENKDIAKELHKVIFNTKDNTVTIDSEYYGACEKISVNRVFYGNKNYIFHNFAGIG